MTLYRLLMWLVLPPDFRRDFGEQMRVAVRDRVASAGTSARVGIWTREVVDLVRTGAREWWALITEQTGTGNFTRRGDGMMTELWRDIRFAIRTLGRAPGFTAVVVATLALGIGANTAIFSVVDAVLLEQLPYDEPDRLVNVWQDVRERGGPETEWFNYEDFADLAAEPNMLAAAGTWGGWQPTLTGSGEPDVITGASVSHEMLTGVLRAQPFLGRLHQRQDDVPGAPGVVVLSYRAWQDRFGADPDVVGRSVTLSENPFTIVGVLPQGFDTPFVPGAEMYSALGAFGEPGCGRGCFGTRVIGRLAPGVSLDQARSRARTLAARLEQAYPETNTNMTFSVVDLREDMTQGSARGLWVLLGAVAFVLLIACTNVANLLLSRAAAREGEMSVRVALGAGRGPLLRQLLTESLVLALAGGTLGLALAWWGTAALLRLAPDGALPRLDAVSIDPGVLAFTAVVTILTGVLFGLLPSWRAARPDVHDSIRSAGRGGTGQGGRLRNALAVLQIAAALVLLVGAGLLIRSFDRLNQSDLGFDPEGVLALQLSLPSGRYEDADARRSFYFTLISRLEALPGATAVGAVNSLPLAGFDGDADFMVEGEPPAPPGVSQATWIRPMSDGYFEAVGLELLQGRMFEPGDDAEAPRVVIVNQTMVDRYYDGDAVGRSMAFGSEPDDATWRTIVGVARDVRHFGIKAPPRPATYLPYGQVSFANMALAVRTSGDPTALAPEVRRVISDMDPSLAASGIRPLRDLVDTALAPDRFVTLLLGLFAVTALLLAAVGIYGVISYGVTRRYREMGIRMALGADSGQVRRLVVRKGMGLVVAGLLVGLAAAFALTGVLQSLLYGVEATDPLTFVVTTSILAGIALTASWIPAVRASRSDPVNVLREE